MSNTPASPYAAQVKKIAVIGSGISGISAAWFLSQKHQVTVFEKNTKLGGHTNTSILPIDGQNVAVDTGFIVFNRPNYPNLTRMLAHLNVVTQDTEMTFSVSVNQGELEYSGNNLNTLFAQRKNLLSLTHWKMIREILRFNTQAKKDLHALKMAQNSSAPHNNAQSLGDYLDQHGFDQHMRNNYLLPMAAAIWSCPLQTMMSFPVASFLQFFENHGLLNIEDRPQWESVVGGSHQYIKALLNLNAFTVKTDATVVNVCKNSAGDGLKVVLQDGHTELFDEVVFGAHADETFVMLDDALKPDFKTLMPFQYQDNIAYLHSDTRLMPQRKLAWASWNYLRDTHDKTRDAQHVSVTYWMNLLQNIKVDTPLLVTLNPLNPPKSRLTHQKIAYKHPVFDVAAMRAQKELPSLQGKHNLWFCGSYFGYGFHEDGLSSAVNLARLWGIKLPWESK